MCDVFIFELISIYRIDIKLQTTSLARNKGRILRLNSLVSGSYILLKAGILRPYHVEIPALVRSPWLSKIELGQ